MEATGTKKNAATAQPVARKEPKKLSKLGEWMRKPNRPYLVINDMKAVLR